MNELFTLILAFGIPVAILLVWYSLLEFWEHLRWKRMWKDLANIADMDDGRVRWRQFLREEGYEDKITLRQIEETFQSAWQKTRPEKGS